jgi:NADPH:quinone reductase-like Zn-dependent oxidoreductase
VKAVVQKGYGAPERVLSLAEIDPPTPGDDDVLVRVHATCVNTPDWITVAGIPYAMRVQMGLRGPKSPVRGTDFAGVVEAVGPNVSDIHPGDEVFGSAWTGSMATVGTYAEQTVAPAQHMISKPPWLTFEEAAGSVMSGVTALSAMRVAEVGPDKSVLVNGASGGVGLFALQFAKALGAEVTGVCSTRNAELVESLGADVVDYTQEDFTRGERRWDVILDNVLSHPPKQTARALAPGGILMPNSIGNTGGLLAGMPRMARAAIMGKGSRDVRFVPCVPNRENLEALAAGLESDARVVIDATYPLADAGKAVAHMLSHRARGKIVITV